jgi:UDP-N-acetylglucosamine:LPS N-acetylglucosamine transferase
MADAVAALLRDRGAWQALAARTRQLARPDAAAAVVAECEALLTTQ